jgi:hypothetical protein
LSGSVVSGLNESANAVDLRNANSAHGSAAAAAAARSDASLYDLGHMLVQFERRRRHRMHALAKTTSTTELSVRFAFDSSLPRSNLLIEIHLVASVPRKNSMEGSRRSNEWRTLSMQLTMSQRTVSRSFLSFARRRIKPSDVLSTLSAAFVS